MGKVKRNVYGLLKYAAAMKSDAEEKVNFAIDALKRSKTKKSNFKSGFRSFPVYPRPRCTTILSCVNVFPAGNPKIEDEKKMLVAQLVEIESLKNENRHLKALLTQKKLE